MQLFEAFDSVNQTVESLMMGRGMVLSDWLSFAFFWMIVAVSIPIIIFGRGYAQSGSHGYNGQSGGHVHNGQSGGHGQNLGHASALDHGADQSRGNLSRHSGVFLEVMTLLFIISMLGVVVATNMVTFLISWELMALFSLILVFYEDHGQEELRSGILYGIMTQLSGIMILGAFMYLYQKTGVLGFSELKRQLPLLSEMERLVPLSVLMAGFAVKAGLFPAHVWLPKAHPIAPSNVSALMSGLMVKIALYGMLRMTYGVFGTMPLNLSLILLAVGMATASMGVFLGMYKSRIKVFLAYSSVENMGILAMGVAASHIFANFGLRQLQVLVLAGVLFHALSHAFFKSLLFMVAGTIQTATGEKSSDVLGGLAAHLPVVGLFSAIGGLAASAVPPFNGFVGELIFFMAFIMGIREVADLTVTLWLTAAVVILAICGGGALWMMVKGFGSAFLGAPRKKLSVSEMRVPKSMEYAMAMTALSVVIMGVLAPFVLPAVIGVSSGIVAVPTDAAGMAARILPVSYTVIVGVLVLLSCGLNFISRGKEASAPSLIGPTWGCGFDHYEPHMQYTPDALTQPGGKFLGILTGYRLRVGKSKKVTEAIHFNYHTQDRVETSVYAMVSRWILSVSKKVVKFQYGYVQVYVLYIMLALFATMYVVDRWL